jgi:hypothetical protein
MKSTSKYSSFSPEIPTLGDPQSQDPYQQWLVANPEPVSSIDSEMRRMIGFLGGYAGDIIYGGTPYTWADYNARKAWEAKDQAEKSQLAQAQMAANIPATTPAVTTPASATPSSWKNLVTPSTGQDDIFSRNIGKSASNLGGLLGGSSPYATAANPFKKG